MTEEGAEGRHALAADRFYLALETATGLASVAVARGRRVISEVFLEGRERQLERITSTMDQAMIEAGVRRSALSGIVVGRGPGSFTGVRVAAAVAKGLTHALGLPLWAVSSLAAAAADPANGVMSIGSGGSEPAPRTPHRYVLFDARGDRVYAACYRVAAEAMQVVVPPHAARVASIVEGDVPPDVVFVGDGAHRHRARLEAAGYACASLPVGIPTASGLVAALWGLGDPAPVGDPRSWEPDYLRSSSAEREWRR